MRAKATAKAEGIARLITNMKEIEWQETFLNERKMEEMNIGKKE